MKILVIGAGKMGEAIVKSWVFKNTNLKKKITVIDTNNKRRNIIKKTILVLKLEKKYHFFGKVI